MSKEIIKVSELDPKFKYEIMKEPGGEMITACFACGTCTASCPVTLVDAFYNPRRIIRMALYGMKEAVLKEEFVWLCSGCYLCQQRCPQGVKITDLMTAIRNIAVREGFIHPSFTAQLDFIYKLGNIYEVTEFDNKKRQKYGLPPIEQSTTAEIAQKIIEAEGLDKLLKKEGE
ncbi:MAG: heterodisulfide reductase [Candidatus Hydrothermota bacterium]|nr:MAG: heterodisulfide reductase [Candidatus Hydrothermae bacterium]